MKKILSILIILLFFGFIVSIFYVGGIWPFVRTGRDPSLPTQENSKGSSAGAEKTSRDKTYSEYINHGMLLEKNGFTGLAIVDYQQAHKLTSSNPEPFIKIGRIHLQNRNYAQAQANFEEAAKVDPNNIDAQVYLGRSLLQQRKIEEAREIFNKLNGDTQAVKYYRGIVAAYFGDYENSKKYLQRALELNTTEDLSKKAGNFLNAYKEFDFNQGASKAHLKTLLARSCNQTGEYQMAISLAFEAIKEQKNYRDAWILLGYAYLNTEKYDDAIEALEQAKKLDSQKPETMFFLGLGYYGKNELKKAALTLEQAKKNGFQPAIQVEQKLAEIYMELKQYDASAKNYENVVLLNDQNINYYIRPIWLYLEKLRQPQHALSLAQRAAKNHPAQAMGYNLLGWAQIGTNQLDDAEKNLEKALQLDPHLDAAYLNFGQLLEKQGQPERALAFYAKAHEIGLGNSISNIAAERYNVIIANNKNIKPYESRPGGIPNMKAQILQP